MRRKLIEGRGIEWIVLVLFSASFIVVSFFHEPWYDEAQAWLIAKDASLKEILFIVPHYEGHPPLWHLILAIPAKLDVPFEIGLKSIGAMISVSSAAVLLFFSKLPRLLRVCIPFSYFFFYQYGIITRPYGLMMLVLLIIGMNMPERNKHPWRMTALLVLLCLCSAYGIVLSGGIAICFVIELICEKGFKHCASGFFRDQRTVGLLVLFVFAVLLLIDIFPKQDTFYPVSNGQNPFWVCAICALLTFPAECFLSSASWFSVDRTLLQTANIQTIELIVFCIIGIILWGLTICSASKRSLKFLVVPYIIFAFFSARVYFSGHHLGIVFSFFLYWAEYVSREENKFAIGKRFLEKIVVKKNDFKLLRISYILIGIACLLVPIIWTTISAVRDVKYNYYYGKEVASFLREKGLEDSIILGSWAESGSLAPCSEMNDDYINTAVIGTAVPINAHLGKNVFFNLNHNHSEQGFVFHRRPSLLESKNDIDEWRSYGAPDVIIGKPDLDLVYDGSLSYGSYSLVALVKQKFMWKSGCVSEVVPVFLRKDLLNEYSLEELDGVDSSWINGIRITEDMKERFYNGEPIEDILKPYLDAMFGVEE